MKERVFAQSLPRDAWRFIQLQVLFGGLSAVLTLFVNTFLLNSFGSYSREVLLYNIILAAAQPAAMLTAMRLTQAAHALLTQRVGFVFYGLALTALCVFGEGVSGLYPLFALMLSFGSGYYYTTYSSQMLCYTQDGNRDLIAGVTGLVGALISVMLPLISGALIAQFGKTAGYRLVFGLAALLACGALVTTMFLPALPKHKKEPAFRKVLRRVLASRSGRLIMLANCLSNCRGFTLPVFVTLLFYNLMPNELLISINSTVGYVVALLGAAVYGTFVHKDSRVRASVVAALTVLIPAVGMLFGLSVWIVMVFNAINGFFGTFHSTPVLNTHFRIMEELGLHGEYGAETHTVRELFVSAGRVLGLVIVWAVPKTNVGAVIVVLFMMMTALADAVILSSIEKSSASQTPDGGEN